MSIPNGYLSKEYAQSFKEYGDLVFLQKSRGWLLKRKIPNSPYFDCMGLYPVFKCYRWDMLKNDFNQLDDDIVSVSLVTDPFGKYNITLLKQTFDIVNYFKSHFITDLSVPINHILSAKRRQIARSVLKKIHVEVCENPSDHLDEWTSLYQHLIQRHNIKDLRTFSKRSFSFQLRTPGAILFRCTYNDKLVGMDFNYICGDVTDAHLAAFTPLGYKISASHGIKYFIIEWLKDKTRYMDLGSVPQTSNGQVSSLYEFKNSWSTDLKPVYLCGKILNINIYKEISKLDNPFQSRYFPAYREGEFG